jgi:hypothetical protein
MSTPADAIKLVAQEREQSKSLKDLVVGELIP